jgi:hypothetical protein
MKEFVSIDDFDQVLYRKFTLKSDEQISFLLQISALQNRDDVDSDTSDYSRKYFVALGLNSSIFSYGKCYLTN